MTTFANDIATPGQFDRLPPHSIDAEAALLGSLLKCNTDDPVVAECRALVKRDHFFQADHQLIFDAICSLAEAGKPLEMVHVHESLVARQLLEEVGGAAYIAQVFGTVQSGALAVHFAKIVRDRALG